MLDYTPALSARYDSLLQSESDAGALISLRANELQSAFNAAALGSDPDAVLCEASFSEGYTVSEVIAEYIGDDLFALLRDAAKGEDMQLRATLLLSVIGCKFARERAEYEYNKGALE